MKRKLSCVHWLLLVLTTYSNLHKSDTLRKKKKTFMQHDILPMTWEAAAVLLCTLAKIRWGGHTPHPPSPHPYIHTVHMDCITSPECAPRDGSTRHRRAHPDKVYAGKTYKGTDPPHIWHHLKCARVPRSRVQDLWRPHPQNYKSLCINLLFMARVCSVGVVRLGRTRR